MSPFRSCDPAVSDSASAVQRSWSSRLGDWGKYATAAGAALATGASAEAGIVYIHPASPVDAKLPGPASYVGSVVNPFTVDGIELELRVRNFDTGYNDQHFADLNATGAKHLDWNSSEGFALGFDQGQPIAVDRDGGATDLFHPILRWHRKHPPIFISGYTAPIPGYPPAGDFVSGQSNFAGFQLPASKGGGLGWMRFLVLDRDSNTFPDELRAIDWAYNDAGGGINAGQVPEPSSAALALLAAGSAGVLAWRRRRPIS